MLMVNCKLLAPWGSERHFVFSIQFDPGGFGGGADSLVLAIECGGGVVLAAFDAEWPAHDHAVLARLHGSELVDGEASGNELALIRESAGEAGRAIHRGPDELGSDVAGSVGELFCRNPRRGEDVADVIVTNDAGKDAQAISSGPFWSTYETRREWMVRKCRTLFGRALGFGKRDGRDQVERDLGWLRFGDEFIAGGKFPRVGVMRDLHGPVDGDRLTQCDFRRVAGVTREQRAGVSAIARVRWTGEASGNGNGFEWHLSVNRNGHDGRNIRCGFSS